MQTVIGEKKSAERYKAEWDASPEIREEFGDNYEVYAAYRTAEDEGRIALFGREKKPRLTVLQTIEKITLEWQLTPSVRDKFSSFEAYRKHRWTEEMAGR
jgi:hypothetical protein